MPVCTVSLCLGVKSLFSVSWVNVLCRHVFALYSVLWGLNEVALVWLRYIFAHWLCHDSVFSVAISFSEAAFVWLCKAFALWLCHDLICTCLSECAVACVIYFTVTTSWLSLLSDCISKGAFVWLLHIYTVTMHLFDCYIFTLWLCHNLMFSVDVSRKLHLYDCITYIHHDSCWMFSVDVWTRLHLFVTCLHCDYVIIECSL